MDSSNLIFKILIILYGYLIGHLAAKRYYRLKESKTKFRMKDYLILLFSIVIVLPGLIPIAGYLLGWFTKKNIAEIIEG